MDRRLRRKVVSMVLGISVCVSGLMGCGKDDEDTSSVEVEDKLEQEGSADLGVSMSDQGDGSTGMMDDPKEELEDMSPEPVEPDDPEPDMSDDMGDEIVSGDEPNEGWIGGRCASASSCSYDGSICLGRDEGFMEDGVCSQSCDRICPDRDGENSITFCVATPQGGRCMPRCDFDLFPQTGCRDDLVCRTTERYMDASVRVPTCVSPEDMQGEELSSCMGDIAAQGTSWSSWAYMTQSPEGEPSYQCTVSDPIKVDPYINSIAYTYYNQSSPRPMYMSCELAAALHGLGDILKDYNIVEVLHIGTFNCRKISGKDKLSQHSYARAIDIWGFVDASGERYVLEDHWEHDTDTPQSPKAKVLYEIAQRMHNERLFHNILTPNYNAGHDNHFHVDLEPGALFIGAQAPGQGYYMGSDRWDELCHEH